MFVALLRHGIAEDRAPTDYHRRLTPRGRYELDRLLDHLVRIPWRPGIILSSPLVRADQTAEMVAHRFPTVPRISTEVLAMGDPEAFQWIAADHPDPLLVGHEPTLGAFGARLLGAPMSAFPLERAGFALFEVERLPLTRPARLLFSLAPRWLPSGP
ncbi:MAG TPA: histidine phosphatase family protein [Myxococcota bacterium]|nr:histidine phosphatase family protein [Myxococcota bacterium]